MRKNIGPRGGEVKNNRGPPGCHTPAKTSGILYINSRIYKQPFDVMRRLVPEVHENAGSTRRKPHEFAAYLHLPSRKKRSCICRPGRHVCEHPSPATAPCEGGVHAFAAPEETFVRTRLHFSNHASADDICARYAAARPLAALEPATARFFSAASRFVVRPIHSSTHARVAQLAFRYTVARC